MAKSKNSEYRMAIKIAGEIERSLYQTTDLTRKELKKITRDAAFASAQTKGSFATGLKETEPLFEGLEKAGTKAFKALTSAAAVAGTAVAGIGTMSANVGIEYESAFAGVKKTTEATTQEYAQMRKEILAMTRDIPSSAAEIASVAEAAGQLGIEKENLLAFSKVMIDLGESTNLASTEAASDLAKFANITNMEAANYDRLGSTIVDLGNNFATTEADIVSMATNMASAGDLAGFTQAQILAMATAMSSVGIEAEAGGSSMSKMIKKIQVAVETNSRSLQDYANVAGKTVEEFKEDFQKDGLSAVAAFISGLNDVERNGKSATVILDEMGLTEVRLSNTLLSLANADELMLNAVETANRAWDENIALSKEAAQRYETTESKLAIMQNGFTEMGIAMYDQFNGPLREGIDVVTELVHQATADISGSNVIHDMAQDIVDGIPTAIRLLKTTTEAVGDFAEPFLEVGGWLADHPQLLESTIVGVGSALVTYKTAKGISSLVSAFASLGPASLPVLGLTGAAAAITGITVAVKKSAAEAKKANLAAHFGDISLSMQEMEDVAAYILSNDSFGQLNAAISELGELDGLNQSIDDTVSELNRMNWKISLGMEVEEDEKELYRQKIASYVSDVQAYVEQEQYAISLSVGLLTGEELENSNIVTQLNEFYSGKTAELALLGRQLNDAVTGAFQDGFLDIDKEKTINDLQQQIADIKASLAVGNYEANLDLLGMKYGGGELDAETYQNLLAEISAQGEIAKQQYEEAYIAANQAQRAMLAAGEENGGISQEEYDANMKELKENYLRQMSEIDIKGTDFAVNTAMQQYSNEIGSKVESNNKKIEEWMNSGLETYLAAAGNSGIPLDILSLTGEIGIESLSGYSRSGLEELWSLTEPMYQEALNAASEYTAAGKEIPEDLKDTILNASALGMAVGDYKTLNSVIGVNAYNNDVYQEQMSGFVDAGYIPTEQISSFMLKDKEPIDNFAREAYDYTNQQLQEQFSQEMEIQAKINFKLAARSASVQLATALAGHADGGIFDKPHVAWFAEEGPEAAIPIDGSQNAVNLWQQTGEMLGVFDRKYDYHALAASFLESFESDSTTNTVNNSDEKIVISPTFEIHVNGETGDTEKFEKAIRDVLNGELKDLIEEVLEKRARDKERFSFS